MAKILTENIKLQSMKIMILCESIFGADASKKIQNIGNWRDFKLKLLFVTTNRQEMFLLFFIIYFRVSMWCDVIILHRYPKYAIMDYTIMSLHLYWGEWEMDWVLRILCSSPEYAIDHNTIIWILLWKFFFNGSVRTWDTEPVGSKLKEVEKPMWSCL